jgi:hypothetical protein
LYLYTQLLTRTLTMNVTDLKKKFAKVAQEQYPNKTKAEQNAFARYLTGVYILDKSPDAPIIKQGKEMLKNTAKGYQQSFPFMATFASASKGKSNKELIKAFAVDAMTTEGFSLDDIVKVIEPPPSSAPDIAEGKVKEKVAKIEGDEEEKKETNQQQKKGEPVKMTITPIDTPSTEQMRAEAKNNERNPTTTEPPSVRELRQQVATAQARATEAERLLKLQQADTEAQRVQMELRMQEMERRRKEQDAKNAQMMAGQDAVEYLEERLNALRVPMTSNDREINEERVKQIEDQQERTKHDVRPAQSSYESETRTQNATTQAVPAIVNANNGDILRNPILVDGNTDPVYAQEADTPSQQNANNAREEERYDEDIARAEMSQFASQQRANAVLVNEGADRPRNIDPFYGQVSDADADRITDEQLRDARDEVEGRRAELDELRRRYEEMPNMPDGERADILRTYTKKQKDYLHAVANLTEAQQQEDLNRQAQAVPDLPRNEIPEGIEGFQQYDARAQSMGFDRGRPTDPRAQTVDPSGNAINPMFRGEANPYGFSSAELPGASFPSATAPTPTPPTQAPQEGQGDKYTYDISNFLKDGGGASGAIGGITQTQQQEEQIRQNTPTDRLQQEIRALLLVYRPLIPTLRNEQIEDQARDAIRTTDRGRVLMFHKYISDIIRSYYGQSQLKVGVIVAPNSGGAGAMGTGGIPGQSNLGEGSYRLTKAGQDQFTHSQFATQETMRGGRNSFRIMENRVPISRPENAPIPRRIPQFLTRARHPFPNLLFSSNPQAGMELRLKPPPRRRGYQDEE